MASEKDKIPQDYLEKLKAWKDKLKENWDYQRKLMIFEGSDGQIVNFTTTSSTTTTTTTAPPNITLPSSTDYTRIVINTTENDSGGSRSDDVAGADTSQLVTIVAITCGSLLAMLILLMIFIRVCRRSSAKQKERISLRRPLNPPEPEEHIYAEIEPLQRTNSPGGASGDSNDVQLPQKKHRKRGVSSFRALSTRIYRFFSHDQSDNQSVFYNRNEQNSSIVRAPEPPERNTSPRKKRAGVKRFESTASRRALLDGDSQVSNASSVDMRPSSSSEGRNNIYNPLLREEDSRVSGPYDHLTLGRGEGVDGTDNSEASPSSPHDYFTLEVNKSSPKSGPLSPVSEAISEESNPLDNELQGNGDCKSEPRASTHDYFILEPNEKEKAKRACSQSPSKSSVKSDKSSPTKEQNGSVKKSHETSPSKHVKPTARPRLAKPKSNPGSPSREPVDKIETINEVNTGGDMDDVMADANYVDSDFTTMDDANYVDSDLTAMDDSNYVDSDLTAMDDANYVDSDLSAAKDTKDDTYVLSKLGKAPEPPPVDDDYLAPMDLKKMDYVDVYPNPPPRSVSLNPDKVEHISSPKKQLQKQESTV